MDLLDNIDFNNINYNQRNLLVGILLRVSHTKVYAEHIIEEFYPKKKERAKIFDELHEQAMKEFHEILAIAAARTDTNDI